MIHIEDGTSITDANRHLWLAMRRDPANPLIGSSSFAAALGFGRYPTATPGHLYLELTGQAPPTEETAIMRRGHYLQPWCLREYELMAQDAIVQQEVWFNGPTFHGVRTGATIDGLSMLRYSVECKSHGWRMRDIYGDESEEQDGIPLGHYLQMTGQMGFAGLAEGRLVAAIDGEDLKVYPVKHSDQDFSDLLAELEKFCWHVANRVPPPFTVEGEAGIMHRLYKWEEARATELDERTGACVARLHQLSAEKSALSRQVSAIDKQQKMLKGEIQGAMKGAGLGRYRDYLVKVKTIAVGAKEAYDYNRVTVTRAKESA